MAGILGDLTRGRTQSARARACLLLLQLDHAAVDKRSWVLAAELSLEAGPPLAALSQHVAPAVSKGGAPYSRLLDPRWAEIALSHLRDTDLSSQKATEDADPKPKGSPKSKAKAGNQAEAA